jgi:hypothetical protein
MVAVTRRISGGNAFLGGGYLISVRKLQSVAAIQTNLMTISLACHVSVKPYIRGTINRNHK